MPPSTRTPTAALARSALRACSGVLLGAALLAGCGSDDGGVDTPAEGVVTLDASPSPSDASGEPSASASSTPDEGSTALPDGPPILRAAITVQRALPGATVVSVEEDDDVRGWDVEAVRQSGDSVTLVVSPGGDRVTLGPNPAETDDDDGALVARARIDVVEALRSAVRTAPEGVVESVQLEDEDGVPIWQVDLLDAGGVRVDAVSGASTPDD